MSEFYENWWKNNKTYTQGDFSWKWPAIKKLIPISNNLNFLDYGCGSGKILEEITKINPGNKYIGIDVSKEALKRAKYKKIKAKFYLSADGKKIPLKSSSVDFITALDVIEHIYDTRKAFQEFYRILKKDGEIIISTPYHGLIKDLFIVIFGFETVFKPFGHTIRFFTVHSLTKCVLQFGFKIKKVGYFGRFFPLWRGFYIVATK